MREVMIHRLDARVIGQFVGLQRQFLALAAGTDTDSIKVAEGQLLMPEQRLKGLRIARRIFLASNAFLG